MNSLKCAKMPYRVLKTFPNFQETHFYLGHHCNQLIKEKCPHSDLQMPYRRTATICG